MLDPVASALTLISESGDVTATESINLTDLDSAQNDPLLSEVFYECKNNLIAKSAIKDSSNVSMEHIEENRDPLENNIAAENLMQKSVSSGCLSSMSWTNGDTLGTGFINIQAADLVTEFGIKRACSEGDIQTLGNSNLFSGRMTTVRSSFEKQLSIGNSKIEDKIQERRQKLSRYMKKKSMRNFGRKVKYACRKELADKQPRVRGRFVKLKESEVTELQK